ncbi:DoxX family membrane protein [Fodinicola acaciae]|uniref:DoxX family membrane protein n=1 Tax=Fodinicola acaciae TaxID=2681555 RepID=UPI0013CF7B47|nr:DoxX family membrane protein [Fodinicola acaciae]
MSAHNLPITGAMQIPGDEATKTATTHGAVMTTTAAKVIGVTRILAGLVFLWAFADKLFGLGYSTTAKAAWINGGSPTKGFLSHVEAGPLAGMFRGWAGAPWADWLFMIGLLAIGVALIAGVAMRIAAGSGALMMVFMWAAEWPLARFTEAGTPTGSTNPLLDYHIVYALLLITLAVVYAGNTFGFGRWWASLPLVRKNPWLF